MTPVGEKAWSYKITIARSKPDDKQQIKVMITVVTFLVKIFNSPHFAVVTEQTATTV